jgi:hypothetical protein
MSDGTAVFAEKSKSFYSAQIYEEAREKNAQILDRLCDLEDKIEQGKIVELPCKVGDKIFALSASHTKIYEFTIREFLYDGKYVTVYGDGSWGANIAICTINDIGKGEVFIDRASAEAKLREMEGDNNE